MIRTNLSIHEWSGSYKLYMYAHQRIYVAVIGVYVIITCDDEDYKLVN